MMNIQSLPNKGWYVKNWKAALALPDDAVVKMPWPTCITTAGKVKRDLRMALDRRINSRGGIDDGSEDPDFHIALCRDAQKVKDWFRSRVRFYQLETPLMQKRYGHIAKECMEDQ